MGSCNNWVTSVTTPVDWNQYHIRGDYNLSAASRIMVRYTQDGWKNGSGPSQRQHAALGRR